MCRIYNAVASARRRSSEPSLRSSVLGTLKGAKIGPLDVVHLPLDQRPKLKRHSQQIFHSLG